MTDDIGGVWRTVGGRRIFIKDGQDLSSAMKESGKFGKNKKTKKEYKHQSEYDEYLKRKRTERTEWPIKHYEKLKELGLSDEEIANIPQGEIYKQHSKLAGYRTKEDYKEIAKKQIEEKKKYEIKREKEWTEYKQAEKEREEIRQEKMKSEGVSRTQLLKEEEASRYREEKQREVREAYRALQKNQTGYTDEGKSVRAVKAEYEGKFPKSEAAKMLGVSPQMIEKYVELTEWHHSGGTLYNEVDYYDISKYIDIANSGIDAFYGDDEYKKYIKNYKKMTKRK